MKKFFQSFRFGPGAATVRRVDEAYRQGVIAGRLTVSQEQAAQEQEALDRAYSTGYQLGYISAHSGGGVPGAGAPDPAAWIWGVDRR